MQIARQHIRLLTENNKWKKSNLRKLQREWILSKLKQGCERLANIGNIQPKNVPKESWIVAHDRLFFNNE